ncbi:MAG: hypothetical protein IJE46_06800 [Clostridia bacterium]|nr:hypothetical protein [Clostridia bacterium]
MKLSEVKIGETFPVAGVEFIKVKETEEGTVVVAKECVFGSTYGKNNNFSQSEILKRLTEEILPKIEDAIGAENVLEFATDLTSLDGLKTYGSMTSKISIPTFDFYRDNVEIFDKHKIDTWWWLATADSTPEHVNDRWCVCVSPSGDISNYDYYDYYCGVRPVLVFVSDIFVSSEE